MDDPVCLGCIILVILLVCGVAYVELTTEYESCVDEVIYKESEDYLSGKVIQTRYLVYTKDCYKFTVSEEFYNHVDLGDKVEVITSKRNGAMYINTTSQGLFPRYTT